MTHGIVAFAGIVAVADTAGPLSADTEKSFHLDPRVLRLEKFFKEKNCPAQHLAEDFVIAADRHQLDWRLLPSISFVESTGGKAYKNNNIFGWANGRKRFATVRHGLHRVASELQNSKYYRNRDLDGILKMYNPRPEYAKVVKAVMRKLGPVPNVPLAYAN